MPFVSQLEPRALQQQFLAHPPQDFQARTLEHGVPAFDAVFDLLTTADSALRARVAGWPLQRLWRRWLRPRTSFVGSTVSEYAWLPRAADPAQLPGQWRAQLGRERPLLIVKDIPQHSPLLDATDNAWAHMFLQACERSGYVLLRGQALAWVPIDFASTDEYLARLSRGRRRNIRRKLRSRADLQIEAVPTGAAFADPALRAHCYALYLQVYAQSEVHFDLLSEAFFDALLTDADAGGLVFTYRHQGRLIGWNLCYVHDGRLLDKYIGLHYPDAREHNLYALSWMHNLDYACRHGLRAYVAGWTDPEVKAQLGASFTYTWHAVYLRNPLLRIALLGAALDGVLPARHGTVLLGSGDFHHLSLPLIVRQAQRAQAPLRVVVFDNHPDNMRFPFAVHCGSWVWRVAALPQVARVEVVGITSGDVGAAHAWENHLRPLYCGKLRYWCSGVDVGWARRLGLGRAVCGFGSSMEMIDAFLQHLRSTPMPTYLSLDKDVLDPQDVRTNWDQGELRVPHLLTAIAYLHGQLLGSDITGEVSEARYPQWWKRRLAALDAQPVPSPQSLATWQAQQHALNLRLLEALAEAGLPR